jgi:arsenate reductase-like glutaredoxin family protein
MHKEVKIQNIKKFETEEDLKSILKNISKFYKKLFLDLAKAKKEKFRETLNSNQRRSKRLHLVDNETPFKIGTCNSEKS